MNITFRKNNEIPKLSWCLEINKLTSTFFLEHGSNVEVGDDFFVEGGWDGDFEEMDFNNSTFFLGSGGKFIEDKLILATPSHTLERIVMFENNNYIYFSNSIPFILSKSKNKLDSKFLNYEECFASILNGVREYIKSIPLEKGELNLYYFTNIEIDLSLNIIISEKNKTKDFKNFKDYYERLNNYLSLFKKNIESSLRKNNKYEFITTISKGYDAAATSVIAKKYGCETAVTFDSPNKYKDDCGEELALKMGFKNIVKRNANSYLRNNELLEAEYISSGELGTGIVFSAFDELFSDKVVFFGERGDKIWSKGRSDVNNSFRFENELYAGTSMIEPRLKLGYILFPLPLFGADNWISIDQLTNSLELKGYSVGGNYDRPIPRKILEDSGINRFLFGYKKNGAGFNYRFDSKNRLKSRMSSNTFRIFNENYKSKDNIRKKIKYLNFLYSNKEYFLNYLLFRLKLKISLKTKGKNISNPYTPLDLFHWSTNIMIERYNK